MEIISPTRNLGIVVRWIGRYSKVIGTSLHGIIIAEVLGILPKNVLYAMKLYSNMRTTYYQLEEMR